MAATKSNKVTKLPFWVHFFSCTKEPLTYSRACIDYSSGPYATQALAEEKAQAWFVDNGEEPTAYSVVIAQVVAVMERPVPVKQKFVKA